MAQQSSGVNSKHFFAIAISCGRLERVGAVMNSGNLKKALKSGIIAITLLVATILTTQQLEYKQVTMITMKCTTQTARSYHGKAGVSKRDG